MNIKDCFRYTTQWGSIAITSSRGESSRIIIFFQNNQCTMIVELFEDTVLIRSIALGLIIVISPYRLSRWSSDVAEEVKLVS